MGKVKIGIYCSLFADILRESSTEMSRLDPSQTHHFSPNPQFDWLSWQLKS